MDQTQNTSIGADELRVDIRAGEEYAATPRLKTALDELAAALEEIDDNDTTGFADLGLMGGFSLLYGSPTTIAYTENDSKGKKKGNIEYSWKVEKGEA